MEWDVRESDRFDNKVRMFFLRLSNVPAPEYEDFDTVYEVEVDGELAGMAAVDTFISPRPLLFCLGVRPEHRRQGIGAALLERCLDEHGDGLYCRVRKDNETAIALVESVGLKRHESMWDGLWQYEPTEPKVKIP